MTDKELNDFMELELKVEKLTEKVEKLEYVLESTNELLVKLKRAVYEL